jgi:hypothetical protein
MYLSDFSGIQLSGSDRDAAFPRVPVCSAFSLAIEPEGTHAALWARKDRKDQRRFHGVEAYNTGIDLADRTLPAFATMLPCSKLRTPPSLVC